MSGEVKRENERDGLAFWTGDPEILIDDLDSHTAASVGNLESLLALPEEEMDKENICGWTPLMYAAYLGHPDIVGTLLDEGAHVRPIIIQKYENCILYLNYEI